MRINSASPIQPGAATVAPNADAKVSAGARVTLDGTPSLIVGTPIGGYQWSQVSGPTVALTQPTAAIAIGSARAQALALRVLAERLEHRETRAEPISISVA